MDYWFIEEKKGNGDRKSEKGSEKGREQVLRDSNANIHK